jgi:hypothetical protein
MKKLLFIGNSHLATIKMSEKFSAYPVDFVGFSLQPDFNIDLFENTLIGDGIQIADSSPDSQKYLWKITTGSSSSLDLSPYDAYFVVGILSPPNPWRYLRHFDSSFQDSNLPLVSFDCYSQIIKCSHAEEIRLALYITSVIKKNNKDRLVFFVPLPYIRDDADFFDKALAPPAYWIGLSEEDKLIHYKYEAVNYDKLLKNFGLNLVMPPANLIINGNRCPSRYSISALGSGNFADSTNPVYGDTDLLHKNQEYGKEWWGCINNMIDKLILSKYLNKFFSNTGKLKTSFGTYIFFNDKLNSCVHNNELISLPELRSVYCSVSDERLKLFFIDGNDQLVGLEAAEDGDLRSANTLVHSSLLGFKTTKGYDGFSIINLHSKFLCASPEGFLKFSRDEQRNWETFNVER